ncbi:hypothetical protein MMC30_006974 [Trapelia coarctata]|nr:hypothetical protein [Trapelia coarctata]
MNNGNHEALFEIELETEDSRGSPTHNEGFHTRSRAPPMSFGILLNPTETSTHNGTPSVHNEGLSANNEALPTLNGSLVTVDGASTTHNRAPLTQGLNFLDAIGSMNQNGAGVTHNGDLSRDTRGTEHSTDIEIVDHITVQPHTGSFPAHDEALPMLNGDVLMHNGHIPVLPAELTAYNLRMQNGHLPTLNEDDESMGDEDIDSDDEEDDADVDANNDLCWSSDTEDRLGQEVRTPKRFGEIPPQLVKKCDKYVDNIQLLKSKIFILRRETTCLLDRLATRVPYQIDDPSRYDDWQSSIYWFKVAGDDTNLGYMCDWVVARFEWPEYWVVDHANRVVELLGNTMEERNHRMDETLRKERERGTFGILKNWAEKVHPVYGAGRKLLLSIERAGTALFGVTVYSVHLIAYLLTCIGDVTNEEKFDVWTPRRSWGETYPSCFDNSVCAYLCTGEEPCDKVIKQTVEDGYFPRRYVKYNVQAVGTVSYFNIRNKRMGGEAGLIQPECVYVYDLRFVPEIPQPDPERLANSMMQPIGVAELKLHLLRGRFKDDCALVFIDFIIRHGFLNPKNEPDYIEIVSRLHRRSEFPTRAY